MTLGSKASPRWAAGALRRAGRALLAGTLLAAGLAQAQAWPTKPVRIVVPFSPGGTTDLMGRLLAQGLAQATGGTFVVDSKPGGSGTIGSADVAKAAPDGHTLLVSTSSTHTIGPHLSSRLPYHAVDDFTAIAHLADSDLIVLVTPKLPVRNVAELIAMAREKPGFINYATSGVGTISHLAFEAFAIQAGVSLTHIPYKGTGNTIPDLVAGNIHLALDAVATGVPHVTEGRLRSVGVTGSQRNAIAPDLPTVTETLPGYTIVSIFALWGPRGMAPDLTRRINEEVQKVMRSPEMAQRVRTMGLVHRAMSPAEFTAYLARDSERWGALVKRLKIKVD